MNLQPCALRPLPLGAIQPAGWLLRQLRIQADGLSGHLDEFWPDVQDSRWFGGRAEGWERAPYWLDGVVPLAFVLNDEPLKAKVVRHVDYILRHQLEDGWLGPGGQSAEERKRTDLWNLFLTMRMLGLYGEATGDERAPAAIDKCLRMISRHIDPTPLFNWSLFRSFEGLIPLFARFEQTGDGSLLDLAATLNCQGFDWIGYYQYLPAAARTRATGWSYQNHVVNTAMALKAPALLWRLSGDPLHRRAARTMLDLLDRYHGQATGIFTGDECLAGKDPAQGTELCAVADMMYSLEILTSTFGDPYFADRLERVTFNAWPGTFSPDMWTHQYDQQANQILCADRPTTPWTTNGPDSNTFGLEPNYGCCTANLNQGWPRFAAHLWMATPDDGLAAVAYAPCRVKHQAQGATVDIEVVTDYPFRDRVQVVVQSDKPARFPLLLRIPAWAEGATVRLAGSDQPATTAGEFYRIERAWQGTTEIELTLPLQPRGERRYRNSLSISRGPLVYALKIAEQWTPIHTDRPNREPPHGDYEVRPTSPWNYGLDIDESTLADGVTFTEHPVGDCPFSPEGAPVSAKVKGRRLPQWQDRGGDATDMPESPTVSQEPREELTLLPYGCTHLRITEFPTLR